MTKQTNQVETFRVSTRWLFLRPAEGQHGDALDLLVGQRLAFLRVVQVVFVRSARGEGRRDLTFVRLLRARYLADTLAETERTHSLRHNNQLIWIRFSDGQGLTG